MCYEYDREYQMRRAEEARKAMQKVEEERRKPRPGVQAPMPESKPVDVEPVPV